MTPWARAKKLIPPEERCPICGWRHGPLTMDTDLLTWRGENCGDWGKAQEEAKERRKAEKEARRMARRRKA